MHSAGRRGERTEAVLSGASSAACIQNDHLRTLRPDQPSDDLMAAEKESFVSWMKEVRERGRKEYDDDVDTKKEEAMSCQARIRAGSP